MQACFLDALCYSPTPPSNGIEQVRVSSRTPTARFSTRDPQFLFLSYTSFLLLLNFRVLFFSPHHASLFSSLQNPLSMVRCHGLSVFSRMVSLLLHNLSRPPWCLYYPNVYSLSPELALVIPVLPLHHESLSFSRVLVSGCTNLPTADFPTPRLPPNCSFYEDFTPYEPQRRPFI